MDKPEDAARVSSAIVKITELTKSRVDMFNSTYELRSQINTGKISAHVNTEISKLESSKRLSKLGDIINLPTKIKQDNLKELQKQRQLKEEVLTNPNSTKKEISAAKIVIDRINTAQIPAINMMIKSYSEGEGYSFGSFFPAANTSVGSFREIGGPWSQGLGILNAAIDPDETAKLGLKNDNVILRSTPILSDAIKNVQDGIKILPPEAPPPSTLSRIANFFGFKSDAPKPLGPPPQKSQPKVNTSVVTAPVVTAPVVTAPGFNPPMAPKPIQVEQVPDPKTVFLVQ